MQRDRREMILLETKSYRSNYGVIADMKSLSEFRIEFHCKVLLWTAYDLAIQYYECSSQAASHPSGSKHIRTNGIVSRSTPADDRA